MALQKQDVSNVLRHLKYDVMGLYTQGVAGAQLAYGGAGYRYFGVYGSLLYRLNQLAPDEEARIVGRAYGAVGFTGPGQPTPGDIVGVTITGGGLASPVSVSVTVPSPTPTQPLWTYLNVAASIAQALLLVPALTAGGFNVCADYGSGIWSNQVVPLPIVSVIAPATQTSFTFTATYTGSTVPQVYMAGIKIPPYLSFRSAGQLYQVWGYLPIMDYLEGGYLGATNNLSMSQADNVILRMDELDQRQDQREQYRQEFAQFLGIPINPDRNRGSGGCSVMC